MQRKIIAQGLLIDEALSVNLQDRISVPSNRKMTDAGQMHVPCRFARTGTQLYTAGQLGMQGENPKKIITVFRDEADVFDEDSMESFRSAPVTIGHPKDEKGKALLVTADNAKELQVGMLEGMPTRDEDTLGGTLVLTNQEAIDALEDGTQELSAGYSCDIELVDGKYFQRNIRANHIAIVAKGRAGSSCRVSDEAFDVQLEDGHPQPMQWDFENEAAYKEAFKSWIQAEYIEYFGSADAEGKAGGNVGTLDEATLELFASTGIDLSDKADITIDEVAAIITEALATADAKLDAKEIEAEQLKVELADAKLAATKGVLERSQTIEHARLIADMRIEDLAEMSTQEIKKLVVEDQNPEKDYSNKNIAFIDAMFEILVDASKGETPMGKLLKSQESHVVVDAKPVDPVAQARANMIKRQASLTSK